MQRIVSFHPRHVGLLTVFGALTHGASALAEEPSADGQAPSAVATAGPPKRWFAHVNIGVPVYTSVGAWTNPNGGTAAAGSFTPVDRFSLIELVGAGYWIHPNIRMNLSFLFSESLTAQPMALPPGATSLTGMTFMSAIAWAAFTFGPAFVGLGGMVGPRWMGNSLHHWTYADGGVFTCLGVTTPLGGGFTGGLAVQAPITFNPALVVTVVPALTLGRRF